MPAETHVHQDPLSRQEVLEIVRDVLADILSVDPGSISEGQSFVDDLGADSLDTVELVMALEEEFDIEVPEEDLKDIQTIGQAFDLVVSKL